MKRNYKGFVEHIAEAKQKGMPIDRKYLVELAKKYNTPVPYTQDWLNEFGSFDLDINK